MKKWKSLFYFLKTAYATSWKALVYSLALTALKAALPIVTAILSSKLLGQLTMGVPSDEIVRVIFLILAVQLTAGMIQPFLANRFLTLTEKMKDDFRLRIGIRMMRMEYGKVESSKVQDIKQQALLPIVEWNAFEFILNEFVPAVLGGIMTIVATFFLVLDFGILLLFPVLLLVAVQFGLTGMKNKKFQTVMSNVGMVERRLDYYNMVTDDFSMGKDIRIFRADRMLMKKIKDLNDREVGEFSELFYKASFLDFWETWVTQIQVYMIYFAQAIALFRRMIDIEAFFRITGLFINFAGAVFQTLNAFSNLRVQMRFLEGFMNFEQLPMQDIQMEDVCQTAKEIEFRNVSFHYEGADTNVLEDVNFSVPQGTSVALVGVNGSGKTTVAKLVTGLLSPTDGQILVDGMSLSGNARRNASAVYQDFQLFAFTIRENIETGFSGRGDAEKTLRTVGLDGLLDNAGCNLETYLYQAWNEGGITLSGGQGQKLAMARALYKDAGLVVLDEPTSAYDAKAEEEIFRNFRKLTEGKTALLISHRLASCRFCDKIIVLDGGRIVEEGSHEQLMRHEHGKYREMFLAQAEYYQK
ncbi:MAG: ABC transporter ATP-binding protein [Lachnospiraceae bacterium]|nr:ABC transporter ATP-binding protein [Lachnospiraceae bacterium]